MNSNAILNLRKKLELNDQELKVTFEEWQKNIKRLDENNPVFDKLKIIAKELDDLEANRKSTEDSERFDALEKEYNQLNEEITERSSDVEKKSEDFKKRVEELKQDGKQIKANISMIETEWLEHEVIPVIKKKGNVGSAQFWANDFRKHLIRLPLIVLATLIPGVILAIGGNQLGYLLLLAAVVCAYFLYTTIKKRSLVLDPLKEYKEEVHLDHVEGLFEEIKWILAFQKGEAEKTIEKCEKEIRQIIKSEFYRMEVEDSPEHERDLERMLGSTRKVEELIAIMKSEKNTLNEAVLNVLIKEEGERHKKVMEEREKANQRLDEDLQGDKNEE